MSIQLPDARQLSDEALQVLRRRALRGIELGYSELAALEWFGIFVPAQTPAGAVAALYDVIREAARAAAFNTGLARLSLEAADSSPGELAELIIAETQRWAKIVNAVSFKPLE